MRIVAALIAIALAIPAHAIILDGTDHLKCYKAKDPTTKTTYTADLGSISAVLPDETGCKARVPAKMVCDAVAATFDPKSSPHTGEPLAELLVCYKLKCPKLKATFTATDEFATRSVTGTAPRFLCAPANVNAD